MTDPLLFTLAALTAFALYEGVIRPLLFDEDDTQGK